MPPDQPDGPLAGIQVLDLTRFFPGSYCTLALAQLGADVVKIEHPLGDHVRNRGSEAPANIGLQRGKRSVTLNLKSDRAAGVLHPLVQRADVLVESAQPGVMERLGFGYQDLVKVNPRLVWCSITTFGQNGPYAGRGAHDLQVLGLTGLLQAFEGGSARPPRPRAAVATPVTGLMAATGIIAALRERDRTGAGSRVEVSMLGATLWLMSDVVPAAPAADPLHVKTAASDVYECADGEFLTVSAIGPQAWRSLVEATGCPLERESAPRAEEDDRRAAAELRRAFLSRPRRHWLAVLHEAGVPAGPVLSVTEAVADPGNRASGALADAGGPAVVTFPARLRPPSPAGDPARVPGVGEHTREVLREAGLTEAEIDELAAAWSA